MRVILYAILPLFMTSCWPLDLRCQLIGSLINENDTCDFFSGEMKFLKGYGKFFDTSDKNTKAIVYFDSNFGAGNDLDVQINCKISNQDLVFTVKKPSDQFKYLYSWYIVIRDRQNPRMEFMAEYQTPK